VKLGKSATETLEMLREAFGENSLSQTTVFYLHSRSKVGECRLKMMNVQGDHAPAERRKILKKFGNSMKTVAE
jgi:hypothetical protein